MHVYLYVLTNILNNGNAGWVGAEINVKKLKMNKN
jgi:hypothetical protein